MSSNILVEIIRPLTAAWAHSSIFDELKNHMVVFQPEVRQPLSLINPQEA